MAVRCITRTRLRPAVSFASASGMVTAGASAASRSATDRQALNPPDPDLETRLRPGFFFFQRAAPIERSTASLGQQSTLSPADFWYAPSAARVFIPALPSTLSA